MDPPTIQEINQLQILRQRISDLELSDDELIDKNLVRFFRARNGDLKTVESMIRNNVEWQATEDIKHLLHDYVFPSYYEDEFPYTVCGFDRSGCPVIVAPFGKWDIQKRTAAGQKEEFVKYIFQQMEKLWTLLKHMSKGGKYMKQVVGIVDLEGLSLRQVTSIDVVEATVRILKVFEANYPETVKAAVVVNAPWAFQIIWRLVKPFLSERTHAKLDFVGNDKEKWREAIMRIADEDQFPEFYGGSAPDSTKYFIDQDGSYSKTRRENGNENGY